MVLKVLVVLVAPVEHHQADEEEEHTRPPQAELGEVQGKQVERDDYLPDRHENRCQGRPGEQVEGFDLQLS